MSTPQLVGSPVNLENNSVQSVIELTTGQIAILSGFGTPSVQIYNDDGSTSGSAISLPAGSGEHITALPNGGIFVAYQVEQAQGQFPNDIETLGEAVDANGNITTQPFVIASPSNGVFSNTLTTLSTGQVAVAWRTYIEPPTLTDSLQIFNADGSSTAGPISLGEPEGAPPPNMAGLTGGNIALEVWNNSSPSFGSITIDVETSALAPVNSTVLRTGINGQTVPPAQIAALTDGGFVVAYDVAVSSPVSQTDYVDVFNADGTQRGSETALVSAAQSAGTTLDGNPLVTGLTDGKFVAVWESTGSTSEAIYAQVFNADGSEDGTAAQVVSWTNASENAGAVKAVTAEQGGNFLVTYADRNGNAFSQALSMVAVDIAPTASAPSGAYSATAKTNLSLQGTGLSVGDVDGGNGSETVTLSVGEGTLDVVAGNSGVTGISNNGSSSVSFSGTIAELNALLGGSGTGTIVYDDTSNPPSASTTLTLAINDNGNTGTGGPLTATAQATIDITAPVSIFVGTAASILADIGALEANPNLALILVTDPTDPVTVPYAQYPADESALGKLGGTFSLLLTGVTGQSFTSFEYDFSAGVFMTADYFYPASGQPYSSYEYVYSAGADFIGSKFFYTNIVNLPYTGDEYDYDGGGNLARIDVTGVTGAAYSSYEYDFVGGILAGKKFDFTTVPSGATYNSYVQDYNATNAFTGEQFFFTGVTGEPYTVYEDDFDANQQLSAIKIGGFAPTSPYYALEEDYAAGNSSTYDAFKVYYTGQSGQFADIEEDVTSANVVTKVVYSDPANPSATPYTSVEQDYTGGALTDAIYDFTNVSGASYYGYQVKDDASGAALTETLDNNDGSHTLYALASNQTLTSISDDTFVGGTFANDTFVLAPTYGTDTISDFASHLTGAGHDTIQFSTSEFANFGAMIATAQNVGSNVVITAPNHDTLVLDNLTTTQLSVNQGDFTFHA